MKINDAVFTTSSGKPEEYPPEFPAEVAFAGRSNVGKSSLMNALLKRKNLVKTSSTPGKTQRINFFEVNHGFYFVDLPGYGYAKVPKSLQRNWGPMMDTYFRVRESLRVVVCLVDSRRGIGELDADLFQQLEQHKRHRILVFTKIDKLKANERHSFSTQIKKKYGLEPRDYFAVSTTKRIGIRELSEELATYLTDVLEPSSRSDEND